MLLSPSTTTHSKIYSQILLNIFWNKPRTGSSTKVEADEETDMSRELEELKLKCLKRWGEEISEFYTRITRTILRTVDYTCMARRRRGLRMIKGDLEFYNLPSLSFDDLVDCATTDVKEDLKDDVAEYNSLISGLMAETAHLIAAHVHKDQRDKLGYPYLAHVAGKDVSSLGVDFLSC